MRLKTMLTRTVALVTAICLLTSGVSAYALDGETESDSEGTIACGNGWTLEYGIADGTATITGVQTRGNGALALPSSVDGVAVTQLSTGLFWDSSDPFVTLTAVSVPSSVEAIPAHCFQQCTHLASIDLEGSLEYIARYAFAYCSSLTELTIPALTGYNVTEDTSSRIGQFCFLYCTSLEKVTFLSGSSDGAATYFSSGNSFSGCDALESLVYYCKKPVFSRGSVLDWPDVDTYYTIDYYQNTEDAENAVDRIARVTYPDTTSMLSIAEGDSSLETYAGSDAIPSAGEGKVWGISDSGLSSEDKTLDDSYTAVIADPDDLEYGWISSSEIASGDSYHQGADGLVDLSDLVVYGPGGTVLDSSTYTLSYAKVTTIASQGSVYTPVDQVDSSGTYQVTATGTGAYSSSTTSTTFKVAAYTPTILDCTSSTSKTTATGSAVARAGENISDTPYFTVVTDTDNWQFGLIGMGLAGVGGGTVVFTDGDDTSSDAYRAIIADRSDAVTILGSTSVVSSSVEGKIKQLSVLSSGGSVDRFTDDTPQKMALDVYQTIEKYGSRYGYTWGDTAVVTSSSSYYSTISASQLIYQEKAPVFFTDADGSLSSETLSALKSGGFDKIVVIGGTSAVSDAVLTQIDTATSIIPSRIAEDDSSSLEASQDIGEMMQSTYGYSSDKVVIASAADPTYVIAAAELAASETGTLLVCASSVDAKKIQSLIVDQGANTVTDIAYVGDFSKIDASFVTRMDAIWTSPEDTAVGVGDTYEYDGSLYRLDTSTSASYLVLLDRARTEAIDVGTVPLDGVACSVTSISSAAFADTSVPAVSIASSVTSLGSGLFSNCSSLRSISIQSPSFTSIPSSMCAGLSKLVSFSCAVAASSIGSYAFSGCTKLTSLSGLAHAKSIGTCAFKRCASLKSFSTTASSIGSYAFSGCTSIASIKCSGALKALPISAFSGCKALRSLTVSSRKLTTIGAKALYGCSKLKTLVFKSEKIAKTKIGSKAFTGVYKKVTVKVPARKLKAYRLYFHKKGLSAKALFKKC